MSLKPEQATGPGRNSPKGGPWEEPEPDRPVYTEVDDLRTSNLWELVEQRQTYAAQEKLGKERVKQLNDEIMPLLIVAGIDKVRVQDWNVTMSDSKNTSYDMEKLSDYLMKKGKVPVALIQEAIQAAKKESPYSYLTVTKVKVKNEGGGQG